MPDVTLFNNPPNKWDNIKDEITKRLTPWVTYGQAAWLADTLTAMVIRILHENEQPKEENHDRDPSR